MNRKKEKEDLDLVVTESLSTKRKTQLSGLFLFLQYYLLFIN